MAMSFLREYKTYILTILFISLFFKILFLISFHIWSSGDTYNYFKLAKHILNFDLTGYNGHRTPGYPLFIILGFFNHKIIVMYQIILGMILNLLIFFLSLEITKDRAKSFIITLIHILNLNITNFEIALLTEFLSLFFLVLLIYLIKRKSNIMIISICATYLFVIRPNMLSVIIFYFLFFIFKREFKKAILFISLPTISAFLWSYLNLKYVGFFTISTIGPQGLNHHTLNFVYCAPENNKYYKFMKELGINLLREYGKDWVKANIFITETSQFIKDYKSFLKIQESFAIETIKNCPYLYIYSVLEAVLKFYYTLPLKYEIYYGPFNKRTYYNYTKFIIEPIWTIMNVIIFLIYIVFLLLPIINLKHIDEIWLLVFFSSIFQALFVYSDNWRFSIPFMPLIIIYVINKVIK